MSDGQRSAPEPKRGWATPAVRRSIRIEVWIKAIVLLGVAVYFAVTEW